MFNSSVLDVAIGLIFVYLSLGLMCTTINEWLAHLLKTRAAGIRHARHRLGVAAGHPDTSKTSGQDPSMACGRR
jgi:hypothetical protein